MTAHLSAALAFALTMLALATIVTMIMEILLRFVRRRNRHLRHMLELIYEQYIAPIILTASGGIKEDAMRATNAIITTSKPWPVLNSVKAYIDHYNEPKVRAILTSLPSQSWQETRAVASKASSAVAPVDSNLERELISTVTGISGREFSDRMTRSAFRPERYSFWSNALSKFANWMGAAKANEMTRDDFIRRLARDDVGKMLQHQAGANTQGTITDIALSFDEVSDSASEYFSNSSRIISILIGIALAFLINIDGYRVYTDFIQDPAKAARIAEQTDTVTEAYLEAKESYDVALAAETVSDNDRAAAIEQFSKDLDSVEDKITGLTSQGLSIGWTFQPYCTGTECADEAFEFPDRAAWFFSVFVTGILIGLGGPFWYDIVMGLTRITQIMRGRPPKEADAAKETLTDKSTRSTELFNVHVRSGGESSKNRLVLRRRLLRLKSKIESATKIPLPSIESAATLPASLQWATAQPDELTVLTESRYAQYKDAYQQYFVS